MKNKFYVGLLAGFLLIGLAGFAQATTITDLYNTGVDDSGVLLADSVDDSHYAITSQPVGSTATDVTIPNGTLIGPGYPWAANDANSRWIGLNTDRATGLPGTYIYETTFTIGQDANLSTALIEGLWGTDNSGEIWLNNYNTGVSVSGFSTLDSFNISSGFQLGTNTLQFYVFNAGETPNPTGLRVDDIVGSYSTVPEPATMLLFGIGLLGLAGVNRKKQ